MYVHDLSPFPIVFPVFATRLLLELEQKEELISFQCCFLVQQHIHLVLTSFYVSDLVFLKGDSIWSNGWMVLFLSIIYRI